MLKDRDKKLMFYSWSYGILAAALIYACCGYGALAWVEQGSYYNNWNGGSISMKQIYMNATAWNAAGVTRFDYAGKCRSYQAAARTDGSQTAYLMSAAGGTVYGTGTFTWSGLINNGAVNDGFTMSFVADPGINWVSGASWYRNATTSQYLFEDNSIGTNFGTGNTPNGTTIDYNIKAYSSGYYGLGGGTVTVYSGSALPDAPVINDFTADATCYAPAEAIVLESNVTGTVDSWLWEIYDSSDTSVWSSTDSVETIVDENFAPGLYQVQLYVENTGGNDFLSKDNWLNITQAGGCGPTSNWTNPFPTQVTTVPTQQFYETMTMPPHIVTNMSGINAEIDKGIFANMSQGYRSYIDYVGEQANTTFTGTFRTLLSPVSLVVNAIAYAISLFSTSINALTVYTTVPLAITAIVINYMPWQIVTLITAGIAIDAILIIILGR